MTSLPGRQRSAATWIVIGVVAGLAAVGTLLTINLLANPPTGVGPTASESNGASESSEPTGTPLASSSSSSTPDQTTAPGSWIATGGLIEPRRDHTATVLPDGKVLVAGGYDALASAELYDPRTRIWTVAGRMTEARSYLTATLLSDGTVLVAGGSIHAQASAELYDPSTGAWTVTAPMMAARYGHTATLLSDGTVLVTGGNLSSGEGFDPPLASAELYDPISRTWTATGTMKEARNGHTATMLIDGTVLVAGGGNSTDPYTLASAELYDPRSRTWTAAGSMIEARGNHTATLLDGKVLVTGGYGISGGSNDPPLASAELYDPRSRSWTTTGSMIGVRGFHTAALLPDGTVLAAGGYRNDSSGNYFVLASAELYDPISGFWTVTGSMIEARYGHTVTVLLDGMVLVTGGSSKVGSFALASVELYDPGGGN